MSHLYTLTPDQQVRLSIGEMFVQNALLTARVEALEAENASLVAQLAKAIESRADDSPSYDHRHSETD